MKNNTQTSKDYLARAIASMPDDFALSDARMAMRKALNLIETVERKRNKRAIAEGNAKPAPNVVQQPVAGQWQYNPTTGGMVNPAAAKQMMRNLDAMLEAEVKKLAALQEKAKNKDFTPIKRQTGNEDMDTILD